MSLPQVHLFVLICINRAWQTTPRRSWKESKTTSIGMSIELECVMNAMYNNNVHILRYVLTMPLTMLNSICENLGQFSVANGAYKCIRSIECGTWKQPNEDEKKSHNLYFMDLFAYLFSFISILDSCFFIFSFLFISFSPKCYLFSMNDGCWMLNDRCGHCANGPNL